MIFLLKKIINFRIFFKKPIQKKILVYDRLSLKFAKALFGSNNLSVYDVRYESVNLAILIKSILKNGLRFIKKNYKFEYFKSVNPKIIYTSIDNNLGFYKLKTMFPNALYIADQNGVRDNKFYNECINFYKNFSKQQLKTDLFFCFGNNEKNRLKKIIKGNIIPLGNSLNNKLKIKKENKKIKKIIFISSGSNDKILFERDIKVFSNLKKVCEKKKLKLIFLDKPKKNRKTILNKKMNFKFSYINSGNIKKKQKFLKTNTLFVFIISTFGYEILSMGIRCVSLNHNQFSHGFKKYSKQGPFWINAPSYNYKYELIEKIISKVINYNNSRWNKIFKYFSNQIMVYDAQNAKKLKIIKKNLE